MITQCYDEFGLPTACSNMELGQQWYDAIQQWSSGSYPDSSNISNYFETHLSPFLNPDSGEVATSDEFLYNYGQYITNLAPDFGSYDRYERLSDVENKRFAADYQSEIGKRMMETGHRGFSGGGESLESRQDYFNKYVSQTQRRQAQEQQDLEQLYTTWGQDFIGQLETLQDSAFGYEPNYEDVGDYTFQGCLDDCIAQGSDWDSCLNDCVGLV